ncbi:acyltransferase family protein [Salinicoccus bachuensis]|uniref:Acyltransferase family protein n=1 Tax=Salinicoccus bachuensis TaxID=3136731 RepID=A0ABZ3CK78_9STAP
MHQNIELERKFRPEIEGLRIIAALLVAVYHIWLGRISGGVDVFFVISGFLITTSIISGYNRTGNFKFFPYITNLVKRLLPSVIVVLLMIILLSTFLLPRSIIDKTFKEFIASLLYYQNWQLAFSNTDYLDREQMSTPLEHFWAMSIQGQFYLVWFIVFTLVFIILKRKIEWNGKRLINTVLGFIFLASLSYSIYLTDINQPWAYFDVSTRVWEFSLGGLLAVNLSRISLPSLLGDIIGWLGLVGLFLTGIIFDVSTMFPGYIALWPMLCAVFILVSGNMETKFGVKNFLGNRWMRKAGGMAFGLYLWHWVLLSFYQYHNEGTPTLFAGAIIILLSFVLSWVVTVFVERPIRIMPTGVRPLGLIVVGVVMNFALLFSLYYYYSSGTSDIDGEYITEDYPGAVAIKEDLDLEAHEPIPSFSQVQDDLADVYEDELVQSRNGSSLKIGEYGVTENHDYTVALVGSSYSAHYLGALQQFSEEMDIKILTLLQVGSWFSADHEPGPKKEWNDNAMAYLDENKQKIDLVIASADIGSLKYPKPPEGMVEQLNKIGDDIGLPVMAIRGNRRFGFNIPEYLDQYGYEATKEKMLTLEPLSDTPPWDRVEYKSPKIHYVDYNEYFKVDGEYEPIIGNILIYFDGGHINNTYSQSLGPILKDDVIELLETN